MNPALMRRTATQVGAAHRTQSQVVRAVAATTLLQGPGARIVQVTVRTAAEAVPIRTAAPHD